LQRKFPASRISASDKNIRSKCFTRALNSRNAVYCNLLQSCGIRRHGQILWRWCTDSLCMLQARLLQVPSFLPLFLHCFRPFSAVFLTNNCIGYKKSNLKIINMQLTSADYTLLSTPGTCSGQARIHSQGCLGGMFGHLYNWKRTPQGLSQIGLVRGSSG
jgi:hypothetical protein